MFGKQIFFSGLLFLRVYKMNEKKRRKKKEKQHWDKLCVLHQSCSCQWLQFCIYVGFDRFGVKWFVNEGVCTLKRAYGKRAKDLMTVLIPKRSFQWRFSFAILLREYNNKGNCPLCTAILVQIKPLECILLTYIYIYI